MRLQIPNQIYCIDVCSEAAELCGSGHKLIAILIATNDFFQYTTPLLLRTLIMCSTTDLIKYESYGRSWIAKFLEIFFCVGLIAGSENIKSPMGCRNRPKLPKFHTIICSSNAYKGGSKIFQPAKIHTLWENTEPWFAGCGTYSSGVVKIRDLLHFSVLEQQERRLGVYSFSLF